MTELQIDLYCLLALVILKGLLRVAHVVIRAAASRIAYVLHFICLLLHLDFFILYIMSSSYSSLFVVDVGLSMWWSSHGAC